MNEKLNELIGKASVLFMTFGIKSLTMNDISRKLGISKKTLYNYVSDKNDLVHKCIELHISESECQLDTACRSSENAIEELIAFSKCASDQFGGMHPSIFYDLQKYHQKSWDLLNSYEEKTVLDTTKVNLKRGMDEGLYRPDINTEIIAQIYLCIVQNIFQSSTKLGRLNISLMEYHKNMFEYHIRGIASEKGIQLINQTINYK